MLPSRVGALFMEMGTGKSRTAIELVRLRAHKIDRVVWFCPVSLKTTIRHEILKHTDCAATDIGTMWHIVGLESVSQSDRIALETAMLITPDTFVIVDESQFIKGHKAKRTQRITEYTRCCRYRLILTGTPMTQGIPDLYSQMYFLSPKILGYNSWHKFAANHLEYDEHRPGLLLRTHNTEYLAAKMQPYVYQVTKKDCLTLPNKLHKDYYFDLTREQNEAYQQAKDDFFDAISMYDGDVSSHEVFKLFTALQSITCGFWTKGSERRILRHERLDALNDVIARIPDDAKVIIWAKYRHSVDEIAAALGDDAAIFYGGT